MGLTYTLSLVGHSHILYLEVGSGVGGGPCTLRDGAWLGLTHTVDVVGSAYIFGGGVREWGWSQHI